MNKDIMKQAGFAKEVELVESCQCPFCKEKVDPNGFRNEASKREFKISGLCQKCQDKTFGKD
jgi:hypothetical protein